MGGSPGSPGNRATFAVLPRLFGDSCANLFRARNPICLRLIVLLLLPLPLPPSSLQPFPALSTMKLHRIGTGRRGGRAANYRDPSMIEWSLLRAFWSNNVSGSACAIVSRVKGTETTFPEILVCFDKIPTFVVRYEATSFRYLVGIISVLLCAD